jgi:hypothetical protein
VLAAIVRVLRVVSILICLIVIASFAVFAVDQTKAASGHQQEQVNELSPGTSAPVQASSKATGSHESAVHKAIDETASALTSPFSGLVSGSSSEWAIRAGKLLAALLVYGFGLGYLARELGVHA